MSKLFNYFYYYWSKLYNMVTVGKHIHYLSNESQFRIDTIVQCVGACVTIVVYMEMGIKCMILLIERLSSHSFRRVSPGDLSWVTRLFVIVILYAIGFQAHSHDREQMLGAPCTALAPGPAAPLPLTILSIKWPSFFLWESDFTVWIILQIVTYVLRIISSFLK